MFAEKSTSYIESSEAGVRIKRMFPDARIIVSFRDPVFRAISNYFFSVRNGLEKRSIESALMDLEPAPETFSSSVSPFNYLQRGHYARQLQKYLEIFDRQQIKVIIFTRFVENLDAIADLFNWLDVDDRFVPSGPDEKINSTDQTYNVEPELIAFLRDYYRPHVQELEELLHLELPEWRQ